MGELETKGSGGVSKETEESKIRRLAELYKMRNALDMEKMRLRTQSCSDKIRNGIDSQFEGFNKRAIDEFNKKAENRQAREDYRVGLEAINTDFERCIDQITSDIKDLREQRTALLLSQKSCKDTIKRMQKSIAQFKMTDRDGNIQAATDFRDLLNSTKKEATELKNAQIEIQRKIKKVDEEIAKREADRDKAYEDRDAKIQELQETKENSLQKRSFVSRIIALFGGGAKARAEALANRIAERNQATKDAKSQFDMDYQEAEQAIKDQKEEIKNEVNDAINNMKGAVVGFGKNVVGFGAKVLDYIGATYDLIGSSAKGSVQNIVKKVFDRLQDFSSQEAIEATQNRTKEAKEKLGIGKKEDKNAEAAEIE